MCISQVDTNGFTNPVCLSVSVSAHCLSVWSLLADKGNLGFICADRWMKNRYGGPLRNLVASRFHLKVYVDMVDTPAFHSDVIAYPAITVISREATGTTRIAHRPPIDAAALNALAQELTAEALPGNG